MKKPIIITIISIFIIAGFIVGGIYYFIRKPLSDKDSVQNKTASQSCLKDNETASFNIIGKRTTATSADIIITDKITNKETFRFRVDNLFPNHGHPYEVRKCGVYLIKEFNWDRKHSKPLAGFREELWKYNYSGEGTPILTFAGEDEKGQPIIYYSYDFRIDFLEKLTALIKGYLGDIDNFATVIKEIKTNEDVFSLWYKDVISKNPDFTGGYFDLDNWTRDGRYFWGKITFMASVFGFFRIERDTWRVDVLSAPIGTQGGDVLNPELGYVTYDDGAPWSGDAGVDEMHRQQYKQESKKIHFYIYNLLTKEQILLATIDDPRWNFQPIWLSDTELQYELPNGEKKIYNISEK